MADQNIYTNITATANFTSLTAQLRAVTAELIKLQATTIGLDRNLSNEVGRMNRAFADTMRATGQFSSHFVTLESDVQKFGKRLDTGRMKLGEYYGVWQGHARKTSTLIKDLAKQQVLMEQAVLQPLGRNAQGQMQYNVHVANGLDVLKNRTALLRQESAILNKVMLDGSNQLINWGKNTQWAGRQLTVGLTVPMMAFGAAAQKAFLEADQQLVRLTKVYGGLGETSAAELKQVRDDVAQTAKELASIYGASYKETIALAADIAATGKQGNDLLVSTQETTRLAILGEVDRQDAMKATLAIQNAFKQSNEELAESINFLNAVENQTSTSLADLVEAIPKAGPVIESLGGDIQDLALYLTAMKEGGVNASEGANAIKSSLASLINPTKVAKEMFRGFGIDLEGIVKNNAGDITRTILELQGALDKLDPLQKSQAIEQLFGKFQFARMGALFNNLGKQGSQTLQVLDLMKASTEDLAGIADRELKAMTESASGQYKRALESIKADLASVGDQFLKISTFVLKTISGILKFVENLPAPIKSLLTFLGGLTAFAGPLIMLTGVLGNFLGYIIKGVFHLKQLFKGGAGFKLLTPEMMAAAEAGRVVEKSFFSDAQAAIALETAVNNLAASFDRLKTSALNSAVATSSSISTMGGSTILSPAGTAANADRMADKNSPYIGSPYSRQFAHTIPSATEQPGTIFGVVPNPGPVNVRVGKNPQMYMDDDLPRVPGVTSISGVSTGIVAGEAAKWHAMTAAIATQSQAELSLLKTEVAATGTVTHELSSVYQAMLPQMQQLTQLAADEGRMIVQQLQQGVITVDQARAKIISLNATIEIMMAETAAQVAAGMGRGINLTTVPFTSQPVVDPVTGKSNMKEMFHKPETAALVDDVARGLGVRTSGGGYSIETTKPRIILPKRGPIRGFNDGGYVYTLADGPLVPGDKNVNYDNTMARIPEGGFVLNQEATRNNPQLVEYAKRSKPYNRGGMIDAMLTPYETVFTPEQTQEMLPILEAANSGQRIQFRNAGGILGGPIVSGKHNYGRFDLLRSLFRRKASASVDELAGMSPIMKMGKKVRVDGDDAHKFVDDALGVAAPTKRKLANPDGYFFVGNWGLNTRKTTNSKINAGAAKPQEIIDDILSLPASEALPALRRFLKVNKVDDDLAETLVLEARDKIVSNIASHGDALIGERLFAKAQHPVYLEIAEQLGLRKKYIDSLSVPGQRRAFRPAGDTKSGFKAATDITPYSVTSVDELMAKNAEFGTDFMGSYGTYNPKGLKVNGEDGAFAHMQLDEFAMGGIIGKNKANYGRLFLGMPRSIKQVQEQRKRRQVMEQTTEAVNASRFAKDEPTNFGKLEEETTGHSFPVGGIGGVYTKPDGTKVFVKPVLDEKAALAEQRYNVIHKDAHELEPPKQEVRVMIDPTDPAGKRKLLVLESPYDPKFAKMPEKMTEDEYFKQLLASALRGDKDLSRGNVGGSLVPDAGTSGVFKTASGLRDYASDMPSVAEQARINLLGVKGGAKKFFAESTIDIPKGMTAEQYHDRMIAEIDYVLPRLKEVVSGPKLGLNKDEQPFYDAIVKRLEDARHVNWKEFHGIHSAVKPTSAKAMTPAALAKIEEALALKERQKGHAASLSDMAFKSDANGFNGGGLINLIKSMAMKRIGAGFGKDTKGGWGVTSLEIGMAEKLFASTGLTKRTQRILYDKFAEQLAKEMPYGYAKNAQGHLVKALEPSIIDSVVRMAASSTLSAPEGRRILSTIDRDILRKKFANWESRKDTPLTKTLQELIFKLEGREKGGPVSGNTPYIVGEKGPELFVPMNNGGIIPNHALGGMIRTGKYNYGALGPVAGIVAQQALPLAAFMLLPKALEKLGIASEKSNLILNGIFAAITAGSIYGGVKRAKAAKAAAAAGSVADDAAETAVATKSVSKFTQSLAKLRLVGMAIPGWGKVAIVALTTLATVSYGAWENARKARLASQEAFDVNEKQAKQLGIAYVSLSDKIKKATEAAQKNSQLTKLKAAGSTAIGGGINMSVKELNALQKKAKETQGDIVEMFNNLDENDVTKAATALKVQLVAAGKSAQDAAREIYSIISVSNKAAQATEAVSSTEFLKVVDRATAARVAIETFVKSMNFGDVDKKEIASSFSGGLDAIQLYYQSLVGVKDASGKAKTQVEALNDTIAHMNANKANQQEIGEDILNTLIKENPLYQDILNKNDSMVDAWAKIQLYTNGVTADLSNISGKEAQGLLQVVNAISQAASEMTTNGNLMHNPLDAIADYGVAAKKAYDEAKKASDDATKNAQKNADAEIKALDKKIEKINEEADARIRAIEDQAEKQDYLTEVQKEQLNYQQALLAGDMSRAAQSQLNIQGLTNERQKNIAIDAINDKRNADVKKLEEQKVGIQERLVKLQEKANKLQEAANVAQKEYAAVQALQQSIATTLSKASITTDEASLPILAEALRSDVAALAALGKGGAAAAKSVTGDVPVTKGTTITTPGGQQIVQPGKQDWVTYLKSLTNNPGGPADSTIEYAKTYFEKFGTHVEDFGLYVKTLTGLDVVGGTRIIPTSKLRGEVKTNSDPRKTEYFAADGTSLGKGAEGRAKYYDNPGKPMSGEAYIYPNSNVNRGALNGVQDINLALYNKGIKTPLVQDGLKYEHNGSVTKGGKVVGYWGYNIPNVGFKSYATGGSVKNFEWGGNVTGPGTATSDSIPAMLSNGEYVIKSSAVDQYGKTFFDALNAQKLHKGGPVHRHGRNLPNSKFRWQPYPEDMPDYWSNGKPSGSPYTQRWGALRYGPAKGKDIWGGTEIPGLPFSGKLANRSDYWHQIAEQPNKSSGPGMGIDRTPERYAGSGASMGGIGNGAYGFGPLMFHKGGPVGHKHLPAGHMASNYKAPRIMGPVALKTPYKTKDTDTRSNMQKAWDNFIFPFILSADRLQSGMMGVAPFTSTNQKAEIAMAKRMEENGIMSELPGLFGQQLLDMTLLAGPSAATSKGLVRSAIEGYGVQKGLPGLGALLPAGSIPFATKALPAGAAALSSSASSKLTEITQGLTAKSRFETRYPSSYGHKPLDAATDIVKNADRNFMSIRMAEQFALLRARGLGIDDILKPLPDGGYWIHPDVERFLPPGFERNAVNNLISATSHTAGLSQKEIRELYEKRLIKESKKLKSAKEYLTAPSSYLTRIEQMGRSATPFQKSIVEKISKAKDIVPRITGKIKSFLTQQKLGLKFSEAQHLAYNDPRRTSMYDLFGDAVGRDAGDNTTQHAQKVIARYDRDVASQELKRRMLSMLSSTRGLSLQDVAKSPEIIEMAKKAGLDPQYIQNIFGSLMKHMDGEYVDPRFHQYYDKRLIQLETAKTAAQTYLTSPLSYIARVKEARAVAKQSRQAGFSGFATSPILNAVLDSRLVPKPIKNVFETYVGRTRSSRDNLGQTENMKHPREVPIDNARAYGPGTYFARTPKFSDEIFKSFGENMYKHRLSPRALWQVMTSKGYIEEQNIYKVIEEMGFDPKSLGGMEWDHPVIQKLMADGYLGLKHKQAYTSWNTGLTGFNLRPTRRLTSAIKDLSYEEVIKSVLEGKDTLSKMSLYSLNNLIFQALKESINPEKSINGAKANNFAIPKFETGINMVPADMLAMLHKNEAVVPANMNPFNPNANNATMGGGVYNITNNINGADCDINELSDIVTRKTIESMKTISTLNMKTVGQNRSLGSSLEVRA